MNEVRIIATQNNFKTQIRSSGSFIKGDKGDQGERGLQGERGPKGDTGDSGVYIGEVEPTDKNVRVWIDSSGGYTNYEEIINKPKINNVELVGNKSLEELGITGGGGQGKDGKSAYQIWLENGNTGTEKDFLNSLKGEQGLQGNNGKDGISVTHSWDDTTLIVTSASGTSSSNLKGDKGEKGEQGIPGENGGIFIPSLDSNGNLSWNNNKGLDNPATVNIKGEKGDTGAPGVNGQDGHTPVKGVDYFTTQDIESLNIPTSLNELEGDSTHRTVTDVEKSIWSSKSNFSGNYNDLSNKPLIPSKNSELLNDSSYVISEEITNIVVVTEYPEVMNENVLYLRTEG